MTLLKTVLQDIKKYFECVHWDEKSIEFHLKHYEIPHATCVHATAQSFFQAPIHENFHIRRFLSILLFGIFFHSESSELNLSGPNYRSKVNRKGSFSHY
jgi:hypothetical protein